MMLVVSGVGTLIHIYAIGYMHEDVRHKHDPGRFRRFFVFLNLFIAMMMILVSGNSYLMLFVGWEGVGLCSFLLIGFWYELDILGRSSWANSNAAKKAFIVNRIGDFGFLIASFLIFKTFGSLQFDAVFSQAQGISVDQFAGDRGDHSFSAVGRRRQIGADPALRLAPGCDGGSDSCFGADPCRDDGDRRCLSRDAFGAVIFNRARGAKYCRPGRGHHRALRRDHCGWAIRHQEGAGLFDHSVNLALWWRRWAWAPTWQGCSIW